MNCKNGAGKHRTRPDQFLKTREFARITIQKPQQETTRFFNFLPIITGIRQYLHTLHLKSSSHWSGLAAAGDSWLCIRDTKIRARIQYIVFWTPALII